MSNFTSLHPHPKCRNLQESTSCSIFLLTLDISYTPHLSPLAGSSGVDRTLRIISGAPVHMLDIWVFSFGKYLVISFTHNPTVFFCYLIAKNSKNTLWVCPWMNWWEYFPLVPWTYHLFYSIFCWTHTSLSQECFLFIFCF